MESIDSLIEQLKSEIKSLQPGVKGTSRHLKINEILGKIAFRKDMRGSSRIVSSLKEKIEIRSSSKKLNDFGGESRIMILINHDIGRLQDLQYEN